LPWDIILIILIFDSSRIHISVMYYDSEINNQ
jgi:hypothetical protein